jgi:hypothetical protein
MIYALPLYRPLRMIEEICMLDQMSGGRLDVDFGRGASPIELDLFGADPADARAIYDEARQQTAEAGADYFVGQFAFGDLPLAETARSIELFARDVMPALRN